MSTRRRSGGAARSRTAVQAAVFAALGDETRLTLLRTLCDGQRRSITELTEGTRLTRQAVTKHLRVLERALLVHGTKTGRESRFRFDPEPMMEMREYLESVSKQWDLTLARLKVMVEGNEVSGGGAG